MIALLGLGLVLTILLPFLYKIGHRWALGLSTLFCLVFFGLSFSTLVSEGSLSKIIFDYPWFELIGLRVSFYQDGFSLFFACIITFIGAMIFLYSIDYFGHRPLGGRYALTIMLFMLSMLGIVLSNNLLFTFLCWELTGLTSFLLIGYFFKSELSRENAKTALFVTAIGDMGFLISLILIFLATNTLEIDQINLLGAQLKAHTYYPYIIGGLLLAAFTKSAQFPFHFWLPKAMVAPTPVSAFLHSATMVKAGVFLVYRFFPLLSQDPLVLKIILVVGFATALVGGFLSLFQNDLKSLLAYTTISSLGIMMGLFGLGTKESVLAGLGYLLAHAFFKSTLFMATGSVDHGMHTRNIDELHDLKYFLPLTSFTVLLGGLSMAGFPPFVGYLSKHLIYEVAMDSSSLVLLILILVNIFMIAATFKYFIPFYFKKRAISKSIENKEHHILLWLPALMTAIVGIIAGVFSGSLTQMILGKAYLGTVKSVNEYKFSLWHGFDSIFFLGIVGILLGIFLFWLTKRTMPKSLNLKISFYGIYHYLLHGLINSAGKISRIFQDGDYWRYILIIMIFAIAALLPSVSHIKTHFIYDFEKGMQLDLAVLILIIVSCFMALKVTSRLGSVLAASGVGLGVTFIYGLYGAPDLAMTQIMVETLTLVLLTIVVRKLPIYKTHIDGTKKIISALVSATLSLFLALITLEALNTEVGPKISTYFAQNSYLKANGKNIVNVILVDFRALDTLGEITVLCLAGLGVYSLLKTTREGTK